METLTISKSQIEFLTRKNKFTSRMNKLVDPEIVSNLENTTLRCPNFLNNNNNNQPWYNTLVEHFDLRAEHINHMINGGYQQCKNASHIQKQAGFDKITHFILTWLYEIDETLNGLSLQEKIKQKVITIFIENSDISELKKGVSSGGHYHSRILKGLSEKSKCVLIQGFRSSKTCPRCCCKPNSQRYNDVKEHTTAEYKHYQVLQNCLSNNMWLEMDKSTTFATCKYTKIWRLLYCNKCKTHYNRDTVSCINVLIIAFHIMQHGVKPEAFYSSLKTQNEDNDHG
jgi:hypothetical protein